jgi:8-oxo-dGTP diphosphatase
VNPVPLRVAVGVVQRDSGEVLMAQRPVGKPYAGWWEFPGGKLETGESPEAALARELHEELNLQSLSSTPWVVREHVYPHATVRLFFRKVRTWQGEPQPCEGQLLRWQAPHALTVAPLLPASLAPIGWLQLPNFYRISCVAAWGVAPFFDALEAALETHTPGYPLWLQWREPDLPEAENARLFHRLRRLRATRPLRLIVSSRHPPSFWQAADGVHLTARDHRALRWRPARPWVVASCHDHAELAHAARIGCDFAVLGPVQATLSHPGQEGLGWQGLARTIALTPLPVYALGGLRPGALPEAQAAGAQGIAMMRGAWPGLV